MSERRISEPLSRWTGLAACALALLLAAPAAAQETEVDEPVYVVIDGAFSGLVNDPVEDQFEVGGDGALGVYASVVPEIALGGRVMAGALAEGDPIPQDPQSRGVGDYGLIAPSIRIRPFGSLMAEHTDHRAAGFYLDASPGAGIFDGDVLFAYSASAGYNIPLGPISIGPQFRFTHFVDTEGRFGDTDPLMISGALEVAFLDEADVTTIRPEPTAAAPMPEPEPIETTVVVAETTPAPNPDLVIDERAYFDYDAVELRPEAMSDLDAVAAHFQEHGPNYRHLVVEGHADDRGSRNYNEALSAARALAVARYLVRHDVPVDAMELRAYGESAPLRPDAATPRERQINRRVQFEVAWQEQARPTGVAPDPNPTMPERVDPAPADATGDADDGLETKNTRAHRLMREQRRALAHEIGQPIEVEIVDTGDPRGVRQVELSMGEEASELR